MKNKVLLLLVSILACTFAASAGGGSSTYYSKITVKTSDPQQGLVYATSEEKYDPKASDFTDKMTTDVLANETQDQEYYLYAKPAPDMALDYWMSSKGEKIYEDVISITGSKDEKSPATETYTAYFMERPYVMVATSHDIYGTATINIKNNTLGDKVTVTAAKYYNQGLRNSTYTSTAHTNFVKFDGWYDQDDVCRSTNLVYTFDVTEKLDLTARFHYDNPITSNDGFYRIRCFEWTEDYMSIVGNYDPGLTNSRSTTAGVIELTPDYNNRFSDPSTVIRLKGENYYPDSDEYDYEQIIIDGVSLMSQGGSTKEVLKNTFEIKSASQAGFYKLYYSKLKVNLKPAVGYHNHERGWTASHNDMSFSFSSDDPGKPQDIMSYYVIEPIDRDHIDEYYFGVKADASMKDEDGFYWATMYTDFAYECYEEDGVEAYYISKLVKGASENTAVLTKIADGVVPERTAVLLKCKGTEAKNNRLIPLTDGTDALTDNLLCGEFQLPTSKNFTNYATFDGSSMRIFGLSENNGIGFYRITDGTKLEANKAWLDISSLGASAQNRIVIRQDMTGIEDVVVEDAMETDEDAPIYNLMGVPVKNPVPGQIYIQNGRKFIAK